MRERKAPMSKRRFLGEFEQMVLLAILQQGERAFGLDVRRELERSAGKNVSRGAFYTTVERLQRKGVLDWELLPPAGDRGGAAQRRFRVTKAGVEALRDARRALMRLWRGLDDVLESGS